jgi:hypothetical protein
LRAPAQHSQRLLAIKPLHPIPVGCEAFAPQQSAREGHIRVSRHPHELDDPLSEGFSYFVPSMPAPVASGLSGSRVVLAPTAKGRIVTAHPDSGH